MSYQSISGDSRVYRSEVRQRQAEETRSRVIAAATELFASAGYARTTLAKIGAAAGVSTETVQGHGPKAALLIAALEFAGLGVSGEDNILNLDIGRRLVAAATVAEALDHLVVALVDLHEGSAPLARTLFAGASSDPELDRYLGEFITGINGQVRRVLVIFRDRGWLRDDVSFDELIETAAVLCSVETYLRMVTRDGWSADAYQAWCRRMLAETVFVASELST